MSHCRFALGVTRHKKVYALSDVAFRLWFSATIHAREQGSDGRIDPIDLDMIPRCPPAGPKRTNAIGELVRNGLWEPVGDGYQIHDYADWQDSASFVRSKREQARERMRRVRANGERTISERSPTVRDGYSSVVDPDLRSSEPEGEPEGEPEDPGRETVCPLNLFEKAEKLGVHAAMAEALAVPVESLRAETRDFVGYWTIGKGAGSRRTGWIRQLRERLRKRAAEGALKAPGLLDHESSKRRELTGNAPPSPEVAANLAMVQRAIAMGDGS